LNARTDGRFLESVGIGLLAEVMATVADGPASFVDRVEDPRCRLAAARAVAVATLATQPAVEAELTLDGVEMSGRFLFVEVMNFGSAGPGLQLTPHADWSDGAFDVVWADEAHRDSLLRDLTRGGAAAGVVTTQLPTRRARIVRLQTDCRAHVDDRLVADAFRLTLTVERKALIFA
jgi:diacylglycerol kinase family enzyme